MIKKKRVVEIVPYSPKWKNEFEKIKSMILSYIGDLIIKVEHVGSTSVEGLAAKAIIDVDVVIESKDVLPEIIKRLAKEGFQHEGNLGCEGREAFNRTFDDGYMKYHLYVCPEDGKGYLEHIALRDYLRTHESERIQYGKLKTKLAELYRYDIDQYVENKTEFIQDILKKKIIND